MLMIILSYGRSIPNWFAFLFYVVFPKGRLSKNSDKYQINKLISLPKYIFHLNNYL